MLIIIARPCSCARRGRGGHAGSGVRVRVWYRYVYCFLMRTVTEPFAACCPACRLIVPNAAVPTGVKLGDLIARLQATLPLPAQPLPPIIPVIDWPINVQVVCSETEYDAHDTQARRFKVSNFQDDTGAVLHLSAPGELRWYVVRKGKGFTGVVQGSHIFSAMVTGVSGGSGEHVDTRDKAELAWRWAHAYGQTAVLPM
jgi:hypothetical protein